MIPVSIGALFVRMGILFAIAMVIVVVGRVL